VDVRPLLGVAPAFLSFGNLPRVGEVRFFGDDLLLFLLPGAVAQPALVEIDNDVGFGHPFLVPVEGFRDRRVVLVRGVPRNRFFVRVVPRTVVVREVHPTTVVVVNDRVADGAGFRRQVDFQQGSAVKKVLVREEDAKGEHSVAVQRTVVFNRDADMNDGKGPGKKQVAQADKRSDHGKGKKRDD
jgi:hypothetical protein